MKRRNLIEEIIRKRDRHSVDETRLDSFKTRLDQLSAASRDLASRAGPDSTVFHQELSRYFPIALVASIEGYFRMAIANLIDIGSPFVERASSLHKANISVDVASAMQARTVSLGEFISHSISLSSIENINRTLSALLGFDFLERLLTSEFDIFENDQPLRLDEARRDFIVALNELFNTRHILCHEFAPTLVVDNGQILRSFTATDILVSLAEVMIWAEEKHQ